MSIKQEGRHDSYEYLYLVTTHTHIHTHIITIYIKMYLKWGRMSNAVIVNVLSHV